VPTYGLTSPASRFDQLQVSGDSLLLEKESVGNALDCPRLGEHSNTRIGVVHWAKACSDATTMVCKCVGLIDQRAGWILQGLHLGKHGFILFAKPFFGLQVEWQQGMLKDQSTQTTGEQGDGLLIPYVEHEVGGLDSVAQLPEVTDELIVPAQLEAASQFGLRHSECPFHRTWVQMASSALRLGQQNRVGPGAATAAMYGVVLSEGQR
jgi:hypothetical protein